MSSRSRATQSRMARLSRRIEDWRLAGRPGKRMPEALWEAAVSLARERGAYRVATETGLNYQNLKRRTEDPLAPGIKVGPAAVEFVELETDRFLESGVGGGTEIEVERADGARLRIRIESGQAVDVAQVAATFAGDRR